MTVKNNQIIKQYGRKAFQYNPLFELGVASNGVNIKSQNGHFIGCIEAKDVPAFISMEKGKTPDSFSPTKDWKNTFSLQLIAELGLVT